MPERPNGTVLKTVEARVSQGSNPCPSAIFGLVPMVRRTELTPVSARLAAKASTAGRQLSRTPRGPRRTTHRTVTHPPRSAIIHLGGHGLWSRATRPGNLARQRWLSRRLSGLDDRSEF